jgi:hypothetical protein
MESINPIQQRHSFAPVTALVLFVGWGLYLLLSPIYFFKSGVPQPADVVLFIISGLGITIFVMTRRIVFNRVFVTLLIMVGLFFAINITHYLAHKDIGFLLASSYYVYNAMAFSLTILVFREHGEKAVFVARIIVCLTLVFQVFYLVLGDTIGLTRNVGTFNNPNQLGYWALLSACYLLLLNHGRRMQWFDIIGFMFAAFLVGETVSRAVAASFALLIILFIMRPYVSIFVKVGVGFIVSALLLFQIAIYQSPVSFGVEMTNLERLTERFMHQRTEDDQVSGRGYDRIIDHPEYLLYGAGEGAHYRFGTMLEIHSGLGTILFSYGFLGFALFGLFILTIINVPIGRYGSSCLPLWDMA